MATKWVGIDEFDSLLSERAERGEGVTPWFQLLIDRSLMTWWEKII